MGGNDLTALSALELSRIIRRREVSCREVMQAYLRSIALHNPRVNAIVSLRDESALLEQADGCDQQLARGEASGWMTGLPIAIKDLTPTRGIRTTLGSPLHANDVPAQDALMVERIKQAGAIVIGKTNTPEFGLGSHTYNQVFGATRNAYVPQRCAGGSSGGAAVALALNMLPIADGSDMGGSLRNPAAFNNVFGMRPSQGRVPSHPAKELFIQQLGTAGPMGRTVADVAMLLATIAGHDPRAPLSLQEDPAVFASPLVVSRTKGLRIGWLGDLDGYLPMEPGVLEMCRKSLDVFASLGCEVSEVKLGFAPERLWSTWIRLRNCIVGGQLLDAYNDPLRRDKLKPEAQWEVESSLRASALDIYQACAVRSEWFLAMLRLYEQVDFLVQPTAQVFPFDVHTHWPREVAGRRMDTYHRWMEVVIPWTLGGNPVMNLPVGFNAQGLPMGIQLIGAPRADRAVLDCSAAYEEATNWRAVRPSFLA